jgi:Recombinase
LSRKEQKAKMGGFPQQAPLGYRNVREAIAGRQVAMIVPDPERAPLVQLAYELYATGEFTQEHLVEELRSRGLTNKAGRPLTLTGLVWLLSNKLYMGTVSWNGIETEGSHEPPGHARAVPPRAGPDGRARSEGCARAPSPSSSEGVAGLRRLRPSLVPVALEAQVPVLLLPRSEGPQEPNRLPREVRRGH